MSNFDENYDKALAAAKRIEDQQSGGTRIKKGLPRALIEKAVKEARIYHGSQGAAVRDQQRLYNRMEMAIRSVAKKMNTDYNHAHDQITEEAKRRGAISALPGKHY